jgi:hypothetical protein
VSPRPKKQTEKTPTPTPTLNIVVPDGERLAAIATLARSVESLAKALTATASIAITDCVFQDISAGPAINVFSDRPRTVAHEHTFRPPAS